ncbi:peptide chain release factor N(5)-glutamine methyltransferase [bacterium]|nr:peptide chain release factor N(5)-glutamine methyltransferase [bacterium]
MIGTDIKQALIKATAMLVQTSPSARMDAEILLCHTLKTSRAYLYTHPEVKLNPTQLAQYQQFTTQRNQGIPIAHITGTREFWSLPLHVTSDTLIPRPETERLIELTLMHLANRPHANILDLGTGSGAIALALAVERPNWTIVACDKSPAALTVACENAEQLNLSTIQFIHSDWFTNIPKQLFDAILSNPPYIAEHDPHLTHGDVRFEPINALVSGIDGLNDIRYLIKHSYEWLLPQGLLLLEHGYDQGPTVTSLLNQSNYQNVQCWQDGQDHDRISGGWRK